MPGHHPSGTHLALSAFPVLGKVQLSETPLFVILLLLRNRILLTSSMAMKCSFITLNLVRAGIRACCKLSAQRCGNIQTTVMPPGQVFSDGCRLHQAPGRRRLVREEYLGTEPLQSLVIQSYPPCASGGVCVGARGTERGGGEAPIFTGRHEAGN